MTVPLTAGTAPQLSLLRRRSIWYAMAAWAAAWGGLSWGLEAALLHMAPDAPPEPWNGVYRLVEAILWIPPVAMTIGMAERWPIESPRRHWRRILAVIGLGLALGPAWGFVAYRLSPVLMPWWRSRGMWGVIAKEAKAMLFGYGTTALLAHVALRVVAQRRQALAVAESQQREAEARLDLLRLELQPESVLRTMNAVQELIAQDVDAANAALVLLADSLDRAMNTASAREVTLETELAGVEAQLALHRASGGGKLKCRMHADHAVTKGSVPHAIVQSLVDDILMAAVASCCILLSLDVIASRAGPTMRIELTVKAAPPGHISQLIAYLAGGRALTHVQSRLQLLFGVTDVPHWGETLDRHGAALCFTVPWRVIPPLRGYAQTVESATDRLRAE